MPWLEVDRMSERVRFVVEALQGGRTMSELCRRFGVSRKTGYKWLGRYRVEGSLSALRERSRRPWSSPGQVSEEVERRVEGLWRQTGWGARKLQWSLEQEGLRVGRSTVGRILKRRGLERAEGGGRRRAVGRFERSEPNELVQMDFKGEYRLAAGGWCYPLSQLDDHSRFSLGLYALGEQRGRSVWPCLVSSFEAYGVPEQMLIDHGTPWWSPTNGHGLTWLSVGLIRQGIELVYSGIGHPQTQGKVERFHRSLAEWLRHHGRPQSLAGFAEAFVRFREQYNTERPHEALGMQPPARRYRPSPRRYQPQPRAWEYPEGTRVVRLNPAGCLDYRQRRYFVCEALAGESVACEEFAGKLLVSFRHMHIREIDLSSGRTWSVLEPLARPSSSRFGRRAELK